MKLKIILLVSLCAAMFGRSGAQVRLDPFYPYSKWTLGAGIGFTEIYGNLSHPNSEPIMRVNVERNSNMWVSLNLEAFHGALSDYEVKNTWTNGMSVYNQINGVDISGRVSLGEFFKYPKNFLCKQLFGLYAGVGIGYMTNHVSNITLKFKHQDRYKITDFDNGNINTKTSNYFMPFNLGFNLHLTRRVIFNVNYEFSYAFSDYLDGYNFKAPVATNKYNDMFSALTFGMNFYIGKVGYHYRKHGQKNYKN